MFQIKTVSRALLRSSSILLLSQCSVPPDAAPQSESAYHRPPHRGINVAGAEFGTKFPGTLGTDYTYPTAQEIADYGELGFDLVRIPVRWERLAVTPAGPFRAEDIEALDRAIDAARDLNMVVVIDLHNYARWSSGREAGHGQLINQGAASVRDLVEFWTRLGRRYGEDPDIWLGIMNEPYGIGVEEWWDVAGSVVAGLRSAGIRNKLLVPGTVWTGAHSWLSSGNAEHAARLRDPLDNMAFEVHQYLDHDSSGQSGDCRTGSAERIEAVLQWAEREGARLFLGEFAAGQGAACRSEYQDMIERLEQSGMVDGWAAWGGGSWFNPNDPFSIPPSAVGGHIEHLRPFLNRKANHEP